MRKTNKKTKNYTTFSIRLSDEENAFIEKVRLSLNQRRPIGYKELDKAGAVRTLMQWGGEAFKKTNENVRKVA